MLLDFRLHLLSGAHLRVHATYHRGVVFLWGGVLVCVSVSSSVVYGDRFNTNTVQLKSPWRCTPRADFSETVHYVHTPAGWLVFALH